MTSFGKLKNTALDQSNFKMKDKNYFKLLIMIYVSLISIDEEFLPCGHKSLNKFHKKWSRLLKKSFLGFTLKDFTYDILTIIGVKVL